VSREPAGLDGRTRRTFPRVSNSVRIARVELVRQWRRTRDQRAVQLVALAFVVLFLLVFTVAAGGGAYFAGLAVARGRLSAPLTGAQYVAATAAVFVFFVTAFRTLSQNGRIDHADGMLTTVPHRDVVGGLLLRESAVLFGMAGPPAVAAAVGFAVGSGSPLALVLVLLAALDVLVTSLLAGFVVGLAVKNLLARSAFVARHRVALGALVFLTYMWLVVSNTLGTVVQPLVATFRASPLAWEADLALFGVVGSAAASRAVASVVTTFVVAPVLVALAVWLAGLLWYADPAEGGTTSTRSDSATSGLGLGVAGAFDGLVARPTAQVAVKSWLRARRAPIKLAFVAYPLFVLIQPISETVQTGRVSPVLPPMLAFYGAWATGAAFTLNPLGDEGAVLPTTLTTGVSGRQFVGGLQLAGVVAGAPATAALTFVAALLSPLSLVEAVGMTVAAAVLCVGATGVAVGVGTAFPRFDAARITRSREAVVPSLIGFGVYSVAMGLVGLPGLATQVSAVVDALARIANVAPAAVSLGGIVLTTVVLGLVAWPSVRYAARTFERYEL